MALPAVNFNVCARQGVPRQGMVEFFLVETHDIEIPAVVVAVTNGAIFSFRLFGGVEPRSVIDPAFYFLVAAQAFVIRNLASQVMAFGAVEHALQAGMRLCQVARRQLRIHLCRKKSEQSNDM